MRPCIPKGTITITISLPPPLKPTMQHVRQDREERAVSQAKFLPGDICRLFRVHFPAIQLAVYGLDQPRPLGNIELAADALGVEVCILECIIDQAQIFGFLDAGEGASVCGAVGQRGEEWLCGVVVGFDVVSQGLRGFR